MTRWVLLLAVGLSLTACKTGPLGPYTSPRVIGQVFSADSGKILADVKVTRGRPEKPSMERPKGGEILMQKAPVTTDENGEFTLESQRVLSVFRGSGWNQVLLTFEKPGYERLHTNYSGTLATNAANNEPLLNIGAVRLQPAHK